MGAELPGTWVKALSRQRVRMRVRDYKVGWGGVGKWRDSGRRNTIKIQYMKKFGYFSGNGEYMVYWYQKSGYYSSSGLQR